MADKDVSRLVVEKSVVLVQRIRDLWKHRFPYGPGAVHMEPAEARRFIQGLDPAQKERLMGGMGPDKWSVLLEELYGKTNSSSR